MSVTDFRKLEEEGWERVAGKYQDVWAHLTRQYIDKLLSMLDVSRGTRLLDVACGPGYAAEMALQRGTRPAGIDFSKTMIEIARRRCPGIEFIEGDAESLPFGEASFDRVTINFGILHFPHPDRALAEVFRVLAPGGKLGFTVWASGELNPAARIMDEAIELHGEAATQVPEGPPYYLFGSSVACRAALTAAGFDPKTFRFETVIVNWQVPTVSYWFEAEKDASVRTAALLAHQPAPRLQKIREHMENETRKFAWGNGYSIPFGAHLVVAGKT